MSRKKYISTGANPLSIDIMDEGILYSFDFRGGLKHPVFKPPVYVTSNVKEQQLLESYPSFNISFKLEETFIEKSETKEEEVIIEMESASKDVEFRNAFEAKNWLNKEHNIPFTMINNKAKVIAKGQELGFNILFESDKN
jgi:hypothetical protein